MSATNKKRPLAPRLDPFQVDTSTTAIYVDSHNDGRGGGDGKKSNETFSATWNGAKIALINHGSAQDLIFKNATNYAFVPGEFKSTKNFGFQKFVIPPDAVTPFELSSPKKYVFTLKQYQDILLDYFLTFTLPDVYSPIYHKCPQTGDTWSPYDFRWIDDPCEVISEYEVFAGNVRIHKGSGKTIRITANRDFDASTLAKFNDLVGAVPEINNPAYAGLNRGAYPNVFFRTVSDTNPAAVAPEPSIVARTIQIPLHLFFPSSGFPLFLLTPTTPIFIHVTIRPVSEWFRVRDVFDPVNGFPLVRPDFTQTQFAMYRFLQPPPSVDLSPTNYDIGARTQFWESNLHIVATYVAVSQQEKDVYRRKKDCVLWMRSFVSEVYPDAQGAVSLVAPKAAGFATSIVVIPQRNDVGTRNEWSNYSNWPYLGLKPTLLQDAPPELILNPNGYMTGLRITPEYNTAVEKDIVIALTLLFEGNERETTLSGDVCRRMDIFSKCPGPGTDGVIHYQFARHSSLAANVARISGIQNWDTLNRVQLKIVTAEPSLSPFETNLALKQNYFCDPINGRPVAENAYEYTPYDYKYNITIVVEMINSILIDTTTGFVQLLH